MKRFGHLVCATRSEIGLKRKNNEDAFGAFPSHGVWCVADGMGGGDDGEIASAAVVQAIDGFCREYPMPAEGAFSAWDVSRGVTAAVNSASSWVFRRAQARRLKGCGSTFAGVVFDATRPADALVMHAGDSRVYHIRGKEIRQVTKDHSAAELVGVKKESELNPMFRGMILRAVGIAETVEVDVTPMQIREGDFVLVCSDGLSRMIPDKKILSIVREHANDVNRAADRLIEAVYAAGAVDNVTAVLISVRGLPEPVAEVPSAIPSGERRSGGRDDSPTRDTSGGEEDPFRDDDTGLTGTVATACPCVSAGGDGTVRASGDGRGNLTDILDGFLRMCRKNPVMTAMTAVLVFLVFLSMVLAAVLVRNRGTEVPVQKHSITGETSRAVAEDAVVPPVKPQETVPSVPEDPVPAPRVPVNAVVPVKPLSPAKVSAGDSAEDLERKKLAGILKAERAKMLKAEAAVAAVAERCQEAAVDLREICRDAAVFPKFLERMRAVAGSAACANVRMCGQTISSMKPDENGFSAAACDLVREIQKFDQVLKGKKLSGAVPRKNLRKLAAMDSTSSEAYELAAAIIRSVAGGGGADD